MMLHQQMAFHVAESSLRVNASGKTLIYIELIRLMSIIYNRLAKADLVLLYPVAIKPHTHILRYSHYKLPTCY